MHALVSLVPTMTISGVCVFDVINESPKQHLNRPFTINIQPVNDKILTDHHRPTRILNNKIELQHVDQGQSMDNWAKSYGSKFTQEIKIVDQSFPHDRLNDDIILHTVLNERFKMILR